MKKLLHYKLMVLLLIMFSPVIHAQFQNGIWKGKQANYWYMAQRKGFNFNVTPRAVLTDGQGENYGNGAISTSDGNLLFYNDGVNVYDRNHTKMPTTTRLPVPSSGTDYPSTIRGFTIPAPGNPNLYYIFGPDYNNTSGGIFYSEVDMTLNNGLGNVNANRKIRIHPAGVSNKLSAVYHKDGKNVWLVGHRANHLDPAHNSDFIAFLISETGVSTTPVVSTTGLPFHQFTVGQMKISPDGTKIALVRSNGGAENVMEVFNFDTATGTVSAPIITLDRHYTSLWSGLHGLEFSPNSRFLYVAQTSGPSMLYQYDLAAGDAAAIENSEVVLSSIDVNTITYNGMQVGPDGKIYLADERADFHAVINYPNNPGAAAGFVREDIPIAPSGYSLGFGYPAFIQSYFQSGILAEKTCFNDVTEFSLLRIPDIISATWDFGDPDSADNTSTAIAPTHRFTKVGTYTVTAIVNTNGTLQTTTSQVTITPLPTATQPADINVCDTGNGTAVFDFTPQQAIILGSQLATDFTVTYYTSQPDADAATNTLTSDLTAYSSAATTIYVRVQNNLTGCYTTTNFNLVVTALPTVTAIPTFDTCDNTTADGLTSFDLTTQQSALLNGQTGITLTYYLDPAEAQAGTNPITTPTAFTNTSNPQTIYVALTNATNCISYTEFTLNVLALPTTTQIPTLFTCDTGVADGLTTFDLTSQDAALINGQTNVTVAYFTTQADADANTNAITTPADFTNTSSSQTIYVRLSNASCYNTTTFTVEALDAPVLANDLTLTGCSPFNLTDIVSDLNIDEADISFYTSETDATEADNAISFPDNYILTGSDNIVYIRAENSNGCFSVAPLTLVTNGCEIQRGISPGDSQDNNTFDLSAYNVTKISIFNRYGKEVYSKNNYKNEWGGQASNGDELPTGTYFYTFSSPTTGNKTGWIYINRRS